MTELGLKRRSARDYVSVGEALIELPLADAAFCEGRLNWSKLRLLARIASAETEAIGRDSPRMPPSALERCSR